MTKGAPIHLIHSFYPQVEFLANSEFANVEDKENLLEPEVQVSAQFEKEESIEGGISVVLSLELAWPGVDVPPYTTARIVHFGAFAINPTLSSEIFEQHMKVSAPSMLYSAAREFIRILTSQGPWDPVLISAVQFAYQNQEAVEPAEEESAVE